MKNFTLNVLATVMAAAIVADVALLWQFNERLARLETKFEDQFPAKAAALDTTIANR